MAAARGVAAREAHGSALDSRPLPAVIDDDYRSFLWGTLWPLARELAAAKARIRECEDKLVEMAPRAVAEPTEPGGVRLGRAIYRAQRAEEGLERARWTADVPAIGRWREELARADSAVKRASAARDFEVAHPRRPVLGPPELVILESPSGRAIVAHVAYVGDMIEAGYARRATSGTKSGT